jgi:hypothetical protein
MCFSGKWKGEKVVLNEISVLMNQYKKFMVATSWWPVLVVAYCTGKQRVSCRSCLSILICSLWSALICNCFGCEPVSPGFILPFCRYRPVQADTGLPAWSSLPTELERLARVTYPKLGTLT